MTRRSAPSGPFYTTSPLVLASASPRRQDFLRRLGLEFALIRSAGVEPRALAGEMPGDYARRAATAKAAAAARLRPDAYVLGADTVVAFEGAILGKPRDRGQALDMLSLLAGRRHVVISACCCCLPDGSMRHTAGEAQVDFFPWPRDVLAAYAATDEVLDKAGAYAIQGQGAFLAREVTGSVSSVVGLPVGELVSVLLDLGVIAARPRYSKPRSNLA